MYVALLESKHNSCTPKRAPFFKTKQYQTNPPPPHTHTHLYNFYCLNKVPFILEHLV